MAQENPKRAGRAQPKARVVTPTIGDTPLTPFVSLDQVPTIYSDAINLHASEATVTLVFGTQAVPSVSEAKAGVIVRLSPEIAERLAKLMNDYLDFRKKAQVVNQAPKVGGE